MKNLLKCPPAAFVVFLLLFATVFSSCSEEGESVKEVTYDYGIVNVSSSSVNMTHDINKIFRAYRAALGVEASPFKKIGTIEVCDREVKEACEKAYVLLENEVWSGNYTFQVRNANTDKVVYKQEFRQ